MQSQGFGQTYTSIALTASNQVKPASRSRNGPVRITLMLGLCLAPLCTSIAASSLTPWAALSKGSSTYGRIATLTCRASKSASSNGAPPSPLSPLPNRIEPSQTSEQVLSCSSPTKRSSGPTRQSFTRPGWASPQRAGLCVRPYWGITTRSVPPGYQYDP